MPHSTCFESDFYLFFVFILSPSVLTLLCAFCWCIFLYVVVKVFLSQLFFLVLVEEVKSCGPHCFNNVHVQEANP